MTKAKANCAHKDRLFRLIFQEKRDLVKPVNAVDRAVDVCTENGVLKELLSVHRAEVKHVILTEYNEELHLKNTFEEGREEGLKEGQISFARLYALECLENNVP